MSDHKSATPDIDTQIEEVLNQVGYRGYVAGQQKDSDNADNLMKQSEITIERATKAIKTLLIQQQSGLDKPSDTASVGGNQVDTQSEFIDQATVTYIVKDYRLELANRLAQERKKFVGSDDFISIPDVVRGRRTAFLHIEDILREETWGKPYKIAKVSDLATTDHAEGYNMAVTDLNYNISARISKLKSTSKEDK